MVQNQGGVLTAAILCRVTETLRGPELGHGQPGLSEPTWPGVCRWPPRDTAANSLAELLRRPADDEPHTPLDDKASIETALEVPSSGKLLRTDSEQPFRRIPMNPPSEFAGPFSIRPRVGPKPALILSALRADGSPKRHSRGAIEGIFMVHMSTVYQRSWYSPKSWRNVYIDKSISPPACGWRLHAFRALGASA
jgi:hypothetical protein